MDIQIIKADYHNETHQRLISKLLNTYALDPMGGGEALAEYTKENLGKELSKRSFAFSILAFVDDKPAGLINAFEGFSTFACKPLINIHDVIVLSEFRGKGLSQKMLGKVEQIARSKGCCKLTLEVLSNNTVAQNAYQKMGFRGYELGPDQGSAQFWQKPLK